MINFILLFMTLTLFFFYSKKYIFPKCLTISAYFCENKSKFQNPYTLIYTIGIILVFLFYKNFDFNNPVNYNFNNSHSIALLIGTVLLIILTNTTVFKKVFPENYNDLTINKLFNIKDNSLFFNFQYNSNLNRNNLPENINLDTQKELSKKQKEKLIFFLKDKLTHNVDGVYLKNLIELNFDNKSNGHLKKPDKTFVFLLYKLFEEGFYTQNQIREIYQSKVILNKKVEHFNPGNFNKYLDEFNNKKKINRFDLKLINDFVSSL